jgi:tetratricopeptide (TPR) repeat protein
MSRTFERITAIALISAAAAWAQNPEEQWKSLVMHAVYEATAKHYAKAEDLFQQALKQAQYFGANDPKVGSTLNSLGLVYREEKKSKEAEEVFRRALPVLETVYGPDSIDVANVNFNIASAMVDQGQVGAAIPFLHKALSTYDGVLGASSVKTAGVLCMLGDAYRLNKDFKEAEGSLRRCADIRETDGGVDNPDLAAALHSLALVLEGQGKYALADPRFSLAEKIQEKTLGIMSPELAQTFEDHAAMLKQMGRDKDAERLTTLAGAIRRTEKKDK